MKKKIAILGSTGSIGKSLLSLLRKDKNKKIILLSANKNYRQLLKQAKEFNVKNIIILDKKKYYKLKEDKKNKGLNIFNNYDCFKKIFKKKIDYTMSSISGIQGLKPTIEMIKFTNKIAIANKESIICAWNLIKKELNAEIEKLQLSNNSKDQKIDQLRSEVNHSSLENQEMKDMILQLFEKLGLEYDADAKVITRE